VASLLSKARLLAEELLDLVSVTPKSGAVSFMSTTESQEARSQLSPI